MAYKFSKGNRGFGDITFEDDADTGIDFEADTIKLETAGNEVLVVAGSLVGIGTSTPDYTLDVAGDIGVDQKIYHNGDANTYLNFLDDRFKINVGGVNYIDCDDSTAAPHNLTINDGGNNIDFIIKGNGSNQGDPLFKTDASTGRVGINGVGSPEHELHVDGTGKFTTAIQTSLIEYTDGDDAITIEDGGYIKLHSGIKYARGVLVSAASAPSSSGGNPDGGWIKFASMQCPGNGNLDTAASSFLITLAGMESSNNRKLDGTFMVHTKFTPNTIGSGTDGASINNAYYEPEGTYIYCEPLNADRMSAAGVNPFNPQTDLVMIFTNVNASPLVDLYIRSCAKNKHCFVTHMGGTGQTNTFDTDIGFEINTNQSWLTTEPTAPANSVKLTGTYSSKIFSKLTIEGDSIIIRTDNTPSSASDFGEKGEIRYDSNYIYLCVATDTWKRVALSTW